MAISLLPLDLVRWDEAPHDALVLPTFADDRPLRGAAGLADWRLCGRLSRLVKAQKADAARGEAMMLPPGRRLPFSRVFWFGLGDSRGYNEDRYRADVVWIARVLADAGVVDYALQAPGRAVGLLGARRALELLLDAVPTFDRGQVALIEDAAGQKDIAELLRKQRARGQEGNR